MPEAQAAVAIVHAQHPEEAVLLIRRVEREADSWSGHWSFPGGFREARDADLLSTALRELEEECAVRLRAGDLEQVLPPRLARRARGPFPLVAPFVLHANSQLAAVADQAEAAETLWLPLEIVRDPMRHRLQCAPGRPPEMLYPAIALSPAPLWGFTYRLLTDWLGLYPEGPLELAGLATANAVLDFVLAHGMTLRQPWRQPASPRAPGIGPMREALLTGRFPAAAVLAYAAQPAWYVHSINLLEVREDLIRIVGATFEEYVLRSTET